MDSIKLRFILIALVALSFTTVQAQPNAKKGRSNNRLDLLEQLKELNLTTEQEVKIKELQTTFSAERKKMKEADLDERKAMMQKQHNAIQQILTEEQRTKFAEIMKKKTPNKMKMTRNDKRQCRTEHKECLDLSDEQKTQIKELRKRHRAEYNQILTPEQRNLIAPSHL